MHGCGSGGQLLLQILEVWFVVLLGGLFGGVVVGVLRVGKIGHWGES